MKAIITLDNSYSRITNITNETLSYLRKELSYQDDPSTAFYSPFGPKTHYLMDKRGSFLTGLTDRLIGLLNTVRVSHEFVDNRRKPVQIKTLKTHPKASLYPAQLNAHKSAINAHRGVLSLPTGSGKSIVIASLIHQYKVSTLVIVPNLELKRQLTETIKDAVDSSYDVDIFNIDATELQKSKKNYDLLIVDEAHHAAASTYQKLNKGLWKNIYRRFYFTATPFRNQKSEQLLFEGMTGSVIYKLDYKTAVKENYIVPIESYYLEVPKTVTELRTWPQVYSQLVVNNEDRNNLIAYLLLSLNKEEKSTLCLVKEIKHGNILKDLTGFEFANGQDDQSKDLISKFNSGKIKTLIGTAGIIGEGVDTKPCEFVIIAGLGKAKSAFMQQCGRAVRKYKDKESAKVIIIKDTSHKFTKSHFNTQKQILLDEYGSVPVALDLGGN